jgi:hypothetical protein
VDEAGNSNETMLQFMVDTAYPEIDQVYPTNQSLLISDQRLFVSFSDDIDPTTIEVFINGAPVRSWWVDNILIIDPVQDLNWGRTYSIDIIGRDAAGNQLIPYELLISFPDRAWLLCYVMDMEGVALNNCSIRVDNRNASNTDDLGYSYLEIRSGPHIITFHMEGYRDLTLEIDLEPGESLNLGTITLRKDGEDESSHEGTHEDVKIPYLFLLLAVILVLLSIASAIYLKKTLGKRRPESKENG